MNQQQLIYRIGAGKGLGLVIGILGYISLPYFVDQPCLLTRIGVLLWYPTVGAFIGVFGVFAKHPILNLPMHWYFRGALIGGWMNLLLVLFAYDQFVQLTDSWNHAYGLYISPYWLILEGVIIGMAMDYLLTRWFGEGLPNGS